MINLEKKYYTKDGCEVKLSHIDGEKAYGYFKDKKLGWMPVAWDASTCWFGSREGSFLDLIEVKPRIKRTVWINVYDGCTSSHSTKKFADTNDRSCGRADFNDRGGVRLACVKVEIDCEEGEGL